MIDEIIEVTGKGNGHGHRERQRSEPKLLKSPEPTI